jgi:hypothetical protein
MYESIYLKADLTNGKIFKNPQRQAQNHSLDINAFDTFFPLCSCNAWFGLSGKTFSGVDGRQYAVSPEKRLDIHFCAF